MNRYIRGKKAGPSSSRAPVKYQSDTQTSKPKIPIDLLNFTTGPSGSPSKKLKAAGGAVPPIKKFKEDSSKKPHQMVKQSVNKKQPIELDEEIYKYNSYQY
jgi:hypothetical protein